MNIKKYFNNNVIVFKENFINDNRGTFGEIYNKKKLFKINIKKKFIQDNYSFSKNIYTLRGLHFQKPPFSQSKLIWVKSGKIYDVVVNINPKSKFYGTYKSFILSSKNNNFIYIDSDFAHGFLTLSNSTEIIYKVDNNYSPKHEMTINWNDNNLNIKWPLKNNQPILSKKDKLGINFSKIL